MINLILINTFVAARCDVTPYLCKIFIFEKNSDSFQKFSPASPIGIAKNTYCFRLKSIIVNNFRLENLKGFLKKIVR